MASYSFLLMVVFLVQYGSAQVFECLKDEQDTLLAFKASISNFSLSLNWTDGSNCCQYQGVTCALLSTNSGGAILFPAASSSPSSASPQSATSVHVVSLFLPFMELRAQIPRVLANLTYLQALNLSGNGLYGEIPLELRSLTHLEVLDFSSNNLSGSITILDSMQLLRMVNVSSNRLSGNLPRFTNGSQLEEFYAGKNRLSGPFSTDLCQHAPNITVLHLLSNNLSSSLNEGLGLCTKLQEVYLSENNFMGTVPEDIYNIFSLSVLWLQDNHFVGGLSEGVGNLQNLLELLIGGNNFSGPLPTSLSKNTQLVTLILNNNNFTGPINVNFSSLTNLQWLDINTNGFTGAVPMSLAECKQLQVLILSKNRFTGRIPTGFNSLTKLKTLSLSTNNLNGSLASLRSCENLVSLVLTKNHFTEPLPSEVDGLRNVQVLALGFLNLGGLIPQWLQNCTKLQVLDLSWNHFVGPIPPWIGGFQYLTYLELSNNSLSGTVPLELLGLISMMSNVTNKTGLQSVDSSLTVKRQSDSPDLTYYQVLPRSLFLSNNMLTGQIPVEVGWLRALVYIDLSHNHFSGSIPASLSNISDLESLDLSSNDLEGPIPTSLTTLTFLSTFNVSYNNLSGVVPTGNQFLTFTAASYQGNPGLCGSPLQPCGTNTSRSSGGTDRGSNVSARRATRIRIIFISFAAVVGLVLVVVVAFCFVFSGRAPVHKGVASSREMQPAETLSGALDVPVEVFHNGQKLTVGDLYRATNNFDPGNIVGCGGFGLVYRADFGDGSRLAIKKLTGDCCQMEREFRAEVDTLSKAQHKNLVSLRGFLHFGNHKLLLYSYMENGSLDYWLHERADGPAVLEWPMRLRIAQGAAAGLAYLHQICDPHIVHRDIKSSNILLDEAFEAHLADFGLARLMMSADTHVTTELVGTLGYIPPEYSDAGSATPRGDIYSFGVVLLELLTGKRPVEVCKPRGCGDLVAWVQQMRLEYKSNQIFDACLRDPKYSEQMHQVLDVACLCINRKPLSRPSIKNIVVWLNEIGDDRIIVK